MRSRTLTVWGRGRGSPGEAGHGQAGWQRPQGPEYKCQTNTSVPVKFNKQLIQVVINLSQYLLEITNYQHAPELALLIRDASISS